MTERQIIKTTCPRDCPDTCGIDAYVTAGTIVGLSGDNSHAITHKFLCRKALNFGKRVYSQDRVVHPLQKVDGNWQQISWGDALETITDRIKSTIDEFGSLAILHYQSAGSLGALKMLNKRFFNLIGGVTEASGSLCGGAGIAGQTLDFGYRTCHDPLDLLNSKFIILWGRNPSETNIHLVPILKEARSRGARIVLIDPVASDTSKFCDMHIAPRPGMDGYLAIAMAKVITGECLHDSDFIDNYGQNYDAYQGILNSISLEEASAACGVDIKRIELCARHYAKAKPAAIVLGWGMQRYEWGAETFRFIDALGAITGNIGVSGGGVSHGRDEAEYFDQSVKGKEFAKHTRKVRKPMLGEALGKLNEPQVKLAFINGANPLNQSPDLKSVKNAFKKIDFVVVLEQFMTDTAESADIVLPVTTYLEEADIVGSYWHSYVGLVNPIIKPIGEAKSDLEIYQLLAERLGFGAEMGGSPEQWIRRLIKPLENGGITFNSLKAGNMRIPFIEDVPFSDKNFKTDSGKFNFVTEFSRPVFGSDEYPLVLLSTHSRQWMHSQVLPNEHKEKLTARIHPVTAGNYGISDGETVFIVSSKGKVAAQFCCTEGVREGVVEVKQGHWAKYHQSLNQVTEAIMSRDGQNACYYQTTVKLQKTR
ncbi:MAG TPA: molybdopterin-dependent oxidoreductase [Candidatus Aquicultor sp.]|jgi:anaerobic selenocysteine-containing dehydrogenase